MKCAALLREAFANVVTGTTRAVPLLLVSLVLAGGLLVTDSLLVRSLVEEAQEYQDVGASTVTVIAPGRIDGGACEALNGTGDVHRAGAIRTRVAPSVLPSVPGSPVPGFEVTASFPLVPPGASAGLLLSSEVADLLRLRAGDDVATDGGRAQVAGVFDYPLDGRRAGFGWSILTLTSERGNFDECWVTVWPEEEELRALLLQVVIPPTADAKPEAPQVLQLNQSLGRSFTGDERFHDRITRFTLPLVFVVGLALAFLAVRSRRLEIASNRHAGARTRDLMIQSLIEMLAWAIPAMVLATVAGCVLLVTLPAGDASVIRSSMLAGAVAFLVGAKIGTLAAVASISERHFFRYFKDRG